MRDSQRTRVCIVNPQHSGGGAEFQLSLLIAALRQAGRFEVFYLAHHIETGVRPEGYEVVRVGEDPRVPFFGYVADFLPLYRALRQIKPHVIYQRVGCGYTGISAFYAQRHQSPLIWHVAHDTDVMPQSLDGGRNFVRRHLEKWSIEYGIRHADCIVTQTRQQDELLARHYGRHADEIVANFHPEPLEAIDKSGPRTVVWVANLKPWKRPEIFVRLAAALGDLQGVQFIMVGAAPSAARDAIWREALLRDIGSTANLTYLGHRSHEEVNQLLARATVLVNTSVHEGFPNTFIQAWMRDTVVASLEVNPDQVLDVNGVGVHARTEEDLAGSVRNLLSDTALRDSYVQRARTYVRWRHSVRNADALVKLIDACAERSQAAAVPPHHRTLN